VKVAIIGTGRMCRGFATALAPRHEVTLGSRDPARAGKVAAATGATRGATYADAAADAEVVIAGDDPQAKRTVFTLAEDMGFHPVDVGPLKATRELERLVGSMLFVRLGPLRVLSPP
jgi:predicted dinucleotide-binding enzyme